MLPVKQVLSNLQKYVHQVCRLRNSYCRALRTRAGVVTDTDISAAIYKEATGIIAEGVLLVPDVMPSQVTSPNASFSALLLFTLS